MLTLVLTIGGVILGFTGSLVLAICLVPLSNSIKFALSMHDAGIDSLAVRQGPVPTGSAQHVIRGMRSNAVWTVLGLVMLCAGFLCQMAVVLLPFVRHNG